MGVERAVTRWYALRQNIQQEIEALERQLETAPTEGQFNDVRARSEQHLAETRARLRALGPCPRPMMG
jgi:hypothetical protein